MDAGERQREAVPRRRDVGYFRDRALALYLLADDSRDPGVRTVLFDMAEAWNRRADEMAAAERARQAGPPPPDPPQPAQPVESDSEAELADTDPA